MGAFRTCSLVSLCHLTLGQVIIALGQVAAQGTVLNLNQQYLAGQITEMQMKQAVMSDPMLAISVLEMKRQNLIDY